MKVGTLSITLYCPWVHSLKEKRMFVKSITAKIRNKFNVSVSEIDCQDIHQTVVIGVCTISSDGGIVNSILDKVINFTQDNSEGQITNSYIEII